jgi:hypothetical protein
VKGKRKKKSYNEIQNLKRDGAALNTEDFREEQGDLSLACE